MSETAIFGQNKGGDNPAKHDFNGLFYNYTEDLNVFYEDAYFEKWQQVNQSSQTIIKFENGNWTDMRSLVVDIPVVFTISQVGGFGGNAPVQSMYSFDMWAQPEFALLNPLLRFTIKIGNNNIVVQNALGTFLEGILVTLQESGFERRTTNSRPFRKSIFKRTSIRRLLNISNLYTRIPLHTR